MLFFLEGVVGSGCDSTAPDNFVVYHDHSAHRHLARLACLSGEIQGR